MADAAMPVNLLPPSRIVYSENRDAVPLIYSHFHIRKRQRMALAAEAEVEAGVEAEGEYDVGDLFECGLGGIDADSGGGSSSLPGSAAVVAFDFGSDTKRPRVSARKLRQMAEERLKSIQRQVWDVPIASRRSIISRREAVHKRPRVEAAAAVGVEDQEEEEDDEDEEEQEQEQEEEEDEKKKRKPSRVVRQRPGRLPSIRKRYAHPLDRNQEEVVLWTYDEVHGSLMEEARVTLSLPLDTMSRAAWRHMMAMEHTVLNMTVKEKRKIYLLMRHLTGGIQNSDVSDQRACEAMAKADYLLTETGMTLGQLSVFHILLTRTQFSKTKHLDELVKECEDVIPELQQAPIHIDTTQTAPITTTALPLK
jgi:hypothetical protein